MIKVLLTFVTVLLMALMISLGFWQLDRAEQKSRLAANFAQRPLQKPLTLDTIKADADFRYYPVTMRGRYDNTHQILLDNKVYQRRVGYQVLTPFKPNNSNKMILINRGWIALGQSRKQLPPIPTATGEQTITGLVYVPNGKPFLLQQDSKQVAWPLLIQAIKLDQLSKQLQSKLYPFVVLLSPKAKDGFVRDWQPATIKPAKHIGYAVQWFAMAATLFIIYIIMLIRSRRKKTKAGPGKPFVTT